MPTAASHARTVRTPAGCPGPRSGSSRIQTVVLEATRSDPQGQGPAARQISGIDLPLCDGVTGSPHPILATRLPPRSQPQPPRGSTPSPRPARTGPGFSPSCDRPHGRRKADYLLLRGATMGGHDVHGRGGSDSRHPDGLFVSTRQRHRSLQDGHERRFPRTGLLESERRRADQMAPRRGRR